jgi:hypothetical protein
MPRFLGKKLFIFTMSVSDFSYAREKKNRYTDTGIVSTKTFLLKNLGKENGYKSSLFASNPSIYMGYLPRFAKICQEQSLF